MNNIQKLEFDILEKTIEFLNENSLKYFLVGGSLLGAIRHKGFIPWDDDIDIGMPRDDFEKLINICRKKNSKINENLILQSFKINDSIYPYCKVVNTKIRIKDDKGIDDYLWIDIFPFDFLPENKLVTKIVYKKENILKKLLFIKNMKEDYLNKVSKSRIKYFIKKIFIKLFLNRIEATTIAKKMDDIAIKTNKKYKNSKYIGGLVWGYGPQEKIYSNDIKIKELMFEGKSVNGIEGYNHYLTNIYGDYMTLPPENKRITHSFQIEEL